MKNTPTMINSGYFRRRWKTCCGRSCSPNDTGVCGCAGHRGGGISGTDRRGWAPELQFQPAVEDMAIRICDEESDDARFGTGVYERARDAVADGDAVSGSYNAVAILAG